MSTPRHPVSFPLAPVQPCTAQYSEHVRKDPLFDTLIPRPGRPDLYVALCLCQRCRAMLIVATGHEAETEENVWQVML